MNGKNINNIEEQIKTIQERVAHTEHLLAETMQIIRKLEPDVNLQKLSKKINEYFKRIRR